MSPYEPCAWRASLPVDLIAPTKALQERRRLRILCRLVLCSGVWCRDLYPCILLAPDLWSGLSLGPDLCPRTLHGPDLSVLFHGPDLCRGILRNLCRGILHNLYRGILHGLNGPDLCPCIFLGRRPSLELLQQAFNRRLTDFGLTSDRQVQEPQQFRHASMRPLQSAANPECRRSIGLLTSTDRCQAEAPICRPAKP